MMDLSKIALGVSLFCTGILAGWAMDDYFKGRTPIVVDKQAAISLCDCGCEKTGGKCQCDKTRHCRSIKCQCRPEPSADLIPDVIEEIPAPEPLEGHL